MALAVHAGLAAGHDFAGRVQFVDAPGKAAWRNRSGLGDIVDLIFLRLAHVDRDEPIGFYHRALTAAVIQSIYRAGSRGKCRPPR